MGTEIYTINSREMKPWYELVPNKIKKVLESPGPCDRLLVCVEEDISGTGNKYLLWLNLPLIREIENAYSVFFEDSLFETLRYQPRLFGERVVDPSIEFVEWPCEENKALALKALDQAWALYYREHSYIKALCG